MSNLSDGIGTAALVGALDGGGAALMLLGGGLGVSCPARRRTLYGRALEQGCAISELPHDCRGRRWGAMAAERIVARLASLVIVVEAQDTPGDLALAREAQALEHPVAAVPGRVTSPLSSGSHALLIDGASVVRGPQDALELLDPLPAAALPRAAAEASTTQAALEPRLGRILARVGAGRDTPDQLAASDSDVAEVLLALSELELMGLLARGDGGRYVSRQLV